MVQLLFSFIRRVQRKLTTLFWIHLNRVRLKLVLENKLGKNARVCNHVYLNMHKNLKLVLAIILVLILVVISIPYVGILKEVLLQKEKILSYV